MENHKQLCSSLLASNQHHQGLRTLLDGPQKARFIKRESDPQAMRNVIIRSFQKHEKAKQYSAAMAKDVYELFRLY